MSTTTQANIFSVEMYDAAIRAKMAARDVFSGSVLVSSGMATVRGNMPEGDASTIGKEVRIPYWNLIPGFQTVTNDGDAITPDAISNAYDTATVAHAGLGFSWTRWSESMLSGAGDPYEEAANGFAMQFRRFVDKTLIAAAVATSGMPGRHIVDNSSKLFDVDCAIDAESVFGDAASEGPAGWIGHSGVRKQFLKLKSADGTPILATNVNGVDTLLGRPVVWSDRAPVSIPAANLTVASSGTTPPAITLTGTADRLINLRVECTTLGNRGTAVIRYSIDGGCTWVSNVTTAATISVLDPNDRNASTGLTMNYANAAAAVDNVWTASGTAVGSLLYVRPNALAFWYNEAALSPQIIRVPSTDVNEVYQHLYYASSRRNHPYGAGRRPNISLVKAKFTI